jgi:hypothetical protein
MIGEFDVGVVSILFEEQECNLLNYPVDPNLTKPVKGECFADKIPNSIQVRANSADTAEITLSVNARPSSKDSEATAASDSDSITIRVVEQGGELCDNGSDDDGDGDVDCDDMDCNGTMACETKKSAACNMPCGFDNTGPDETRAAAVCSVFFPNDGQGQFGGGQKCNSDADCDDGNACTSDDCAGAVIQVCKNTPIAGCTGPPLEFPGDIINIEFDHTVVSFTVNSEPGDLDISSFQILDLPMGVSTLVIEWEIRPGADPARGCHEIEVNFGG